MRMRRVAAEGRTPTRIAHLLSFNPALCLFRVGESAQFFRSDAETKIDMFATVVSNDGEVRRFDERKPMNRNALALLAVAGATLLALSGCASTNDTGGKGKQALVCPQCKMVAVTVNRPYFGGGGRGAYLSGGGTQTYYNDTCPGCQGALTTFFKEGELKHKCSVCKETPFTCPVFHPTNT